MYALGFIALSVLWSGGAQAAGRRPIPLPATAETSATYGTSFFEQLIDHETPSLGTFSQQYWWSDEWWSGEGSPVSISASNIL
jgi:hypothetical protein